MLEFMLGVLVGVVLFPTFEAILEKLFSIQINRAFRKTREKLEEVETDLDVAKSVIRHLRAKSEDNDEK